MNYTSISIQAIAMVKTNLDHLILVKNDEQA